MDLKFDVKEKVEELVKKLQSDPALLATVDIGDALGKLFK